MRYNHLTPAARMSPNREAKRVYNRAVKPSFVCVTECEIGNTHNRAEAATTDHSSEVGVTVTPSADAVARDIGKRRGNARNTERVGGRETRSAMRGDQLNIVGVRGGYGRANRLLPF